MCVSVIGVLYLLPCDNWDSLQLRHDLELDKWKKMDGWIKKKTTILMTASASMVYFIVLFFRFPSMLGKQTDDKLFL